jgi:hypothetical protein
MELSEATPAGARESVNSIPSIAIAFSIGENKGNLTYQEERYQKPLVKKQRGASVGSIAINLHEGIAQMVLDVADARAFVERRLRC